MTVYITKCHVRYNLMKGPFNLCHHFIKLWVPIATHFIKNYLRGSHRYVTLQIFLITYNEVTKVAFDEEFQSVECNL